MKTPPPMKRLKKESFSSENSEKFSTGLTEAEQNRLQRILQVREYISNGNSIRKTARDLNLSRQTVEKYTHGNPTEICRGHGDCNKPCQYGIQRFLGFVTQCINDGQSPSEIHRELRRRFGYTGSFHAFYNHLQRNARQYGWVINSTCNPRGSVKKCPHMVSRSAIFNHLWNRQALSSAHRAYIFENHPLLPVLDRCIREFRDIFRHQCVQRLHCFIDKYAVCGIAPLESFAKGLLNDIDAVEYAVCSEWSNGFVEGTNNKIKMVKRVMYGRCRRELLEAKILL